MAIPFMTLGPGEDRADIEAAIRRVLDRGWFVLGPEVEAFEAEFAAASGVAHAVGVNTGTDALMLALRALDIGAGDETVHSADRDRLQASLAADGIGTLVHYPIPLHRQPAFADLKAADCPVADAVAASVLSLPLHPALDEADVDAVASVLRTFQPASERAVANR